MTVLPSTVPVRVHDHRPQTGVEVGGVQVLQDSADG